ncbi:MAG TPA: YeeE/YedE family protein [Burkholderiales bacterium]|nr:YeeE/YedE family protein [Burkholderiales bacterium]
MIVTLSGFGLALIFGAIAQKTDFCTMGAVSDIVNMGDWNRMRMWLLAIAVAVAGANALDLAGVVDLSRSAYPGPRWPWVAFLCGGFLFGVGMTLGSGCGSRSVIRLGGGNLKSLVVLIFLALSAQMTLRGLFAPAREWLSTLAVQFDQGQDLSWLLAVPLGIGKRSVQPWIAAAVALALAIFVLKDRDFRVDYERLIGGVLIGLVVVGGWYVTGHLGFIAEDPETLQEAWLGTRTARPESFTFIGPSANTLELLQFWGDRSARITFGVAVVLGTLAGAFAYSAAKRRFRWESFASAADTRNHVIGGILMGFGGVTAMGCTIGQGVTGLSTMALGSILTFFSMIAGAVVTMKVQYRRMLREK